MELGISGRTALVLGAGGGLGGAIAERLGVEGANVAAADVDANSLAKSVTTLESTGVKALALEWDLADHGVIDARVTEVERTFGPVDILVNVTGGPPPAPVAGQDQATWSASFAAMVQPVIAITDRVLPQMRARGWGRILTSTSSGALMPIQNLGISNTLRLSLHAWSKTLAEEVGADGVTSNVIVPGRIATRRTRFLDEKRAEKLGRPLAEIEQDSAATMSLRRYGDPSEYADVAAFLCSERASYLTGSVIRVDGGMIRSVN